MGKYNPGQKMFFLTVAFFGVIMVITGLIMWFPFSFLAIFRRMVLCPCAMFEMRCRMSEFSGLWKAREAAA